MNPPAPGVFGYKIISILIVFSVLDNYYHCRLCCCLFSCLSSHRTFVHDAIYTSHMPSWSLWLRIFSTPRRRCAICFEALDGTRSSMTQAPCGCASISNGSRLMRQSRRERHGHE